MYLVNIYDAKTNLSRLIRLVQEGKTVVIGRAGLPVAKLVEYEATIRARKPGVWRGKVKMDDDFTNDSLELEKMFYGESK